MQCQCVSESLSAAQVCVPCAARCCCVTDTDCSAGERWSAGSD